MDKQPIDEKKFETFKKRVAEFIADGRLSLQIISANKKYPELARFMEEALDALRASTDTTDVLFAALAAETKRAEMFKQALMSHVPCKVCAHEESEYGCGTCKYSCCHYPGITPTIHNQAVMGKENCELDEARIAGGAKAEANDWSSSPKAQAAIDGVLEESRP